MTAEDIRQIVGCIVEIKDNFLKDEPNEVVRAGFWGGHPVLERFGSEVPYFGEDLTDYSLVRILVHADNPATA